MRKIIDLFFMVFGIFVLILSFSPNYEFRFGVIGYIAAFLLISFGFRAIYEWYKERATLKLELFKEPNVISFYKNTLKAWATGVLDDIDPVFKKEGKSFSLKKIIKTYLPFKDSALYKFLTQYTPDSDEFLVSLSYGYSRFKNSWFVLTNKRLIQKDGETDTLKEINLKNIKKYNIDKKLPGLEFSMNTGEIMVFKNVGYYPAKEYINFLKDKI